MTKYDKKLKSKCIWSAEQISNYGFESLFNRSTQSREKPFWKWNLESVMEVETLSAADQFSSSSSDWVENILPALNNYSSVIKSNDNKLKFVVSTWIIQRMWKLVPGRKNPADSKQIYSLVLNSINNY